MERAKLLGAEFECDCGKRHKVPTEVVVYGEQAYAAIGQVAAEITSGDTYLVIADTRTWNAAGADVEGKLKSAGLKCSHLILPDSNGESPAADEVTKDFILEHAPEADLILAVGSGVVNDLGKWVSFLLGKPYISVPTAASMNGYASANVAATVDGLKVLFHADACRAVIANPVVINDAPDELTASGLGDVLAKSVSSADWKLNRFLFDDYYCQYSVDLLKDLEPIYLENPEGIRQKEPEALQALFEALLYSSIAMTMTGTSSPASGGEHLISHTLDMLAGRDGGSHDLHGRQVGVGSILTAAIYEKVMEIDTPVFCEVPQHIDEEFWGALSPIIAKEYQAKLERIREAAACLSKPANWQQLKTIIQPDLVPPAKLKNCLQQAGAAHRFADLLDDGVPLAREKFVKVVHNANQMRRRFTILDIAVMLGIIPNQLDMLIDRWSS